MRVEAIQRAVIIHGVGDVLDVVILFRGVSIRRSMVVVIIAADVKDDTTSITNGVHLILEAAVGHHNIAPALVCEPDPEMPDPEIRVDVRPKDIRPNILHNLARRLSPPRIDDFL